jgi:ribosomal protein L35AE/L33A
MLRELKKIDVKGKKFQVSISDEGKFFAQYEHEQISAESLKQLTDRLADRIKKSKRVSIPICMWEKESWSDRPGKIRTGTITGIHGSNDNVLVKFDDEARSEQVSYGDFFDPKDSAELKRLAEALNDAEQAFENFKKKHEIDAKEKVRELLGETGDDEKSA